MEKRSRKKLLPLKASEHCAFIMRIGDLCARWPRNSICLPRQFHCDQGPPFRVRVPAVGQPSWPRTMNLFSEFGVGSDPGDSDGGSANSHRQISLPLCMFLDAGPGARARI